MELRPRSSLPPWAAHPLHWHEAPEAGRPDVRGVGIAGQGGVHGQGSPPEIGVPANPTPLTSDATENVELALIERRQPCVRARCGQSALDGRFARISIRGI